MIFKALLSLVLVVQTAGPAFADAPVKEAAYVSALERIVNQGADAVASGADDLNSAGRVALASVRAASFGRVIDVDAVKSATHHLLTRAGIDMSDQDFENLFVEQTKRVTSALTKGELKLSTDELSFGQSQAAMVEGFATIVIACISNAVSASICVAAGGVAIIVGIVIIVQALRRPA